MMEDFPQNRLVDSQRMFINELSSLQRDNYIIRVSHFGSSFWLVKLQHLSNGRTLILTCRSNEMELREGSKVLKLIPAPSLRH